MHEVRHYYKCFQTANDCVMTRNIEHFTGGTPDLIRLEAPSQAKKKLLIHCRWTTLGLLEKRLESQ